MTGREHINELLNKMGVKASQTRQKTVDAMLAIFADADTAVDAYETLQQIIASATYAKNEAEREARRYRDEKLSFERAKADVLESGRLLAKKESELNEFQKNLRLVETAEARDRLRIARAYYETADRSNAYARTEFTKYLGAILAGVTPIIEEAKTDEIHTA